MCGLHVGVVILHMVYALAHMAVVVATPYSGNLASYTYYTRTTWDSFDSSIGSNALRVRDIVTYVWPAWPGDIE